jgi:hypothetical protein
MEKVMAFWSRQWPSGARSGLWDGNGCKKDREQRRMAKYWLTAERQNGNFGFNLFIRTLQSMSKYIRQGN